MTPSLGPHRTEGQSEDGAESPVEKVMVSASVHPTKWPPGGARTAAAFRAAVPSLSLELQLVASPPPQSLFSPLSRIGCSQSAAPDQQQVHPLGMCQKRRAGPVPEHVTFQLRPCISCFASGAWRAQRQQEEFGF